MKRSFFATALLVTSVQASAALLTFDDVPGASSNGWGQMPTYSGFAFSCLNCNNADRLDWIDTVGSSYNFGAVSGEFTLLNNYGGTGVVRSADASDFTFDGLWARVWSEAPSRAGTLRGFNNGSQVWSQSVTLTTSFAQFAGVAGAIDELRLDLGNYFLVDNLALNQEPLNQVPEPASLALAALGLLGCGLVRRRRAAA